MKKRTLALFLACSLLFSCFGCAPAVGTTHDTSQRLELESVPAEYTALDMERLSPLFTDICALLLLRMEGAVITEGQKQKCTLLFEEELIPICKSIPIYRRELERYLSSLKLSLEEWGKSDTPFTLSELVRVGVDSLITAFGSERAMTLAYHSTSLYLLHEGLRAEEYYDSFGYVWYLEKAEKCSSLRYALENELGRERFCNTLSLSVFTYQLLTGAFSPTEELLLINKDELALLLHKQAALFASRGVTEEDFSLLADIYSSLIPSSSTLSGSELYLLAKTGALPSLARIMPALLALYCRAVDTLESDSLLSLLAGGEDSIAVLCRIVKENPDEYNALLSSLAQYLPRETEEELQNIRSLGLESAYNAFLNDYPEGSKEELTHAILAFAEDHAQGNADAVVTALIRYLCTLSPVITFSSLYQP